MDKKKKLTREERIPGIPRGYIKGHYLLLELGHNTFGFCVSISLKFSDILFWGKNTIEPFILFAPCKQAHNKVTVK